MNIFPELSGVCIAGAGDIPVPMPAHYSSFLEGLRGSIADRVQFRWEVGQPGLEGATLVIDNEPGFSWYRENDRFVAAKRMPWDENRLLWKMTIMPDGGSALIVCDEIFICPGEGRTPMSPLGYPVDQILLMHHLATRRGAIHHAAGGIARDRLFLFLGRSGAGKSTITQLLIKHGGMELLSDDRVISRCIDGRWLGYGTPWPGEAGVARNASAPLGGLFFLKQSTDLRMERLTPSEALDRLLPVTSVLWFAPELFVPQLTYLRELVETVPAFDLHFRKDAESAAYVSRWIENG
jgi:hypothetical protein